MKYHVIVLLYCEYTSAKLLDECLLIVGLTVDCHGYMVCGVDSLLGVVILYHITSIIYCWILARESYKLDGCGCWFCYMSMSLGFLKIECFS